MGQVVAVCGMPGSGKGEFAAVLSDAGVPIVSMGDMIRAEVRRLGMEEAPHVFGEVAAVLVCCTRRGRLGRAPVRPRTNCSPTTRWCSLKVCAARPKTPCLRLVGVRPTER